MKKELSLKESFNNAWNRFDLKEKIFLEIGASAMKSTVYMNGKTICHNTCPYAMYRIAFEMSTSLLEKFVRNCNRQYGDG